MHDSLRRILVWDWAVRGWHWLFAGSVTLALSFALLGGEDSLLFRWHMVFGLAAGFLLAVRVLLGVIGSRHVRFVALVRGLADVLSYLQTLSARRPARYAGHNPLAWLTYGVMFVLLALTVYTGANMEAEWMEESHPALAWGVLASIAAHLAGLAVHTVIHRENVAASMVTGFKQGRVDAAIGSARPGLGAAVVLASLLYLGALIRAYDPAAGSIRLPVIGTVIRMGEHEEGEHGDRAYEHDVDDEHEQDEH